MSLVYINNENYIKIDIVVNFLYIIMSNVRWRRHK